VRLYQPVKGNKNYNFNWDFFAVSFKYNSVFRYMLDTLSFYNYNVVENHIKIFFKDSVGEELEGAFDTWWRSEFNSNITSL